MRLKIVCQICGKVGEIDMEKPGWECYYLGGFKVYSGWGCYRLGDFEVPEVPAQWRDYLIWLCDECRAKHDTTLMFTVVLQE